LAPKCVVVSKAILIKTYIFQRALRLADAKAVEAKAARIKEWVTNKLRELEEQNVHLKVQNAKANDQMELLRNRLEQLQVLGATTTKSRQSSMAEVRKLFKLLFWSNFCPSNLNC
jgi:serine phosphatase RsbU (regulator of sigma subunit)